MDKIQVWFSALKGDLAISVNIDEYDIHERITDAERAGLKRVLQVCNEYQVDDAQIECEIRKEFLKTTLGVLTDAVVHHAFLFEQGLLHSLTLHGLSRLLREGGFALTEHTVVAVLSSRGMIQGPLLSVIGLRGAGAGDFSSAPPPESLLKAWDLALALRQHTSVWSTPLSNVCPDIFQVGQLRPGLGITHKALSDLCDCLAILQFCSSVTEERGVIVARVSHFNGPTIEIPIRQAAIEQKPTDALPIFPLLYTVYRWAFPSESRTKIDVVRRVIRESVPGVSTLTLLQLQERGSKILQAAESTFAIVCRRAFKAYLRSRDEVERGTQEFLNATHQRISALGEEVVGTSLQFFTGALALVVANVFHQDISNRAKQFGFGLALVYVILIAVFRLARLWLQHKSQLTQTNMLIDGHSELPEAVRKTYKDDLAQRSADKFDVWFGLASAFYGLCGLFFIVMLVALR
ncbi:MAG TPA: hypothetical protein VF120_02135 [Ktedonobacterales bacterium]